MVFLWFSHGLWPRHQPSTINVSAYLWWPVKSENFTDAKKQMKITQKFKNFLGGQSSLGMLRYYEYIYIWVNYNNSLTWIVRPPLSFRTQLGHWGWFPLLTMIPGLGRSEVVIIYGEILSNDDFSNGDVHENCCLICGLYKCIWGK